MKNKHFTFAVAYWIVIIITAHFFAQPGYNWTQNTISELASQGHKYKWIMQAGIVGFGVLITLAVGQALFKTKKIISPLLPIAFYGLAVFLAGIYCEAPIDPSIPYSVTEAKLHSLFATTSGISLSMAVLWRMLISQNGRERIAHLILLIAVIGFSALFGLAENGAIDIGRGIIQRLLYLSGFAWLVYQER
ncbi:MAG TPA: DUF998 domain-containing protein [Anaerolineales bacterium]|nr:DUF998 domain-containing protein [Anaerolineales bacterium]